MFGGPDLLWIGIVPGIVAAATLAIVWRVTGRAASAWRTSLVSGYVVGHWTLNARDLGAAALTSSGKLAEIGDSWAYDPRNFHFLAAIAKSYQASEAHDWLPVLALLAVLPDAIACVGRFGPAVGWLLRTALCVFLPWRLVYGSKYWPLSLGPGFDFDMGGWSTGEAMAWIGTLGVMLLVAWQVVRLASKAESQTGTRLPSLLAAIVTVGSAVALVAAGSLAYAQLLAVLTAALVGCGLAAAILKTHRGPEAAAGPLVITFATLLLVGLFYAELSRTDALLLLAAMVVGVGWLPLPTKLSKPWPAVIRSGVCLVLLAIPVVPAVLDLASQMPDAQSETTDEPNPYDAYSN